MAADRKLLTLELPSLEVGCNRSRVLSLSDLALEGLMSPVKAEYKRTPSLTPTPTQFLFPRCVTAEQEAYASGFAQALEEIYRTQGRPGQTTNTSTTSRSTGDITNSSKTSLTASCRIVVTPRTSTTDAPTQPTVHHLPTSTGHCPPVTNTTTGYIGAVFNYANSCRPGFSSGNYNTTNMIMSSSSSYQLPFYSQPMNAVGCSVNDDTGHMLQNLTSYRVMTAVQSPHQVSTVHHLPQTRNYAPQTTQCSKVLSAASCLQDGTNACQLLSSIVPWTSASQSTSCRVTTSSPVVRSADNTNVSTQPAAVNMLEQDQWRLERKRAKNRVAAARCQMRKMERIARLQDKVDALRINNSKLAETARALTNNVISLRQQILMHTDRGCRLLLPEISFS